jgi:RNA polymerase sigma-70 factor (ECF subfamily)
MNSAAARWSEPTHWSLVIAAQQRGTPGGQAALASLCAAYWYPLYAYIRSQGFSADQAEDLTQGFFAHLFEKDTLRAADRARGRFRSFLLTACKHFLVNEREKAHALKRGGGQAPLSLDFGPAEGRYRLEPAHPWTPERLYERRWALTLLSNVLARLREEYQAAGKDVQFDSLKPFLGGEEVAVSYAEVARHLGKTEGAVKEAVRRLRLRYREQLRAEIARTVEEEAQIDDEIRDLFAALGY